MGLRRPFIVLLAFGLVSLLLFATLSDSYGVQRVSVDSTVSLRPNQPLLPTQPLAAAMQPPLGVPTILILSPMKSSAKFLPNFFKNVRSLTYAHAAVSIAFLHSDDNVGTLGPNSTTWDTIMAELPSLRSQFRRVQAFHKQYVFKSSAQGRHALEGQLERRKILAKARNYLLSAALDDEDYVLWIDVDLASYPPDIIETLLATKKSIVVPNCVMTPGGQSYDLNTWKRGNYTNREGIIQPGTVLVPSQGRPSVTLSTTVAACAEAIKMEKSKVWDIQKMLKDEWLVQVSQLKRELYDTIDLPIGLKQCLKPLFSVNYGTVLELFNTNVSLNAEKLSCRSDWGKELSMEGYGRTGNLYLHKLRYMGDLVKIDSVGGAMLMIRADLHREGLVFPSYPYRGRIETEGLAFMAKDMGYSIYGLPNVEVIHP